MPMHNDVFEVTVLRVCFGIFTFVAMNWRPIHKFGMCFTWPLILEIGLSHIYLFLD